MGLAIFNAYHKASTIYQLPQNENVSKPFPLDIFQVDKSYPQKIGVAVMMHKIDTPLYCRCCYSK